MVNIWDRIVRVDYRILMGIAVLAFVIPIAVPFVLPLPITTDVQRFYDFWENDLPDGSVVGYAADVSVGQPNLFQVYAAVMWHLGEQARDRDFKLIFWSLESSGPFVVDRILEEYGVSAMFDQLTYGVDYAMFHYIPGAEVAVESLAKDFWGTTAVDRYGTPVADLPIMANVKTAADFDALFCSEGGIGTTLFYLRHWQGGYPNLEHSYAVGQGSPATYQAAYYLSGQYHVALGGSDAVAQYETILNRPGEGLIITNIWQLTHLVGLVFVIVGNIAFWLSSEREGMAGYGELGAEAEESE